MCHNMCHKRTMQSLCVSTFVTFVCRRGVERQQKETLFLSEDEEIRKVLEGSGGLELENFFLFGYHFLPLDPVIEITIVFET